MQLRVCCCPDRRRGVGRIRQRQQDHHLSTRAQLLHAPDRCVERPVEEQEVGAKGVEGYSIGDLATVTVHVRRLREKIEPDPSEPVLITTVWGVLYRFNLSD